MYDCRVRCGNWAMNALEPRVGAVRSCTAVSESFDAFNRLAAALAKSQDRRASARGFCFWTAQCGTSMVGHGIPGYMSKPEPGAWANS